MSTKEELQQRIEAVRSCMNIQCADGNWNYSGYMMGMANALILALHILDGRTDDVEFFDELVPIVEDEFPELHPIATGEAVCMRAKAV